MINLDAYRAIIFDMDGTLVDSMEGHLEAWQQTCEQYGLTFDRGLIHSLSGMPSQGIAGKLIALREAGHDPAEVAQHKIRTWRSLDVRPSLIPPTHAIFQHYLGRLPIAIGTGAQRDNAELILERVGVLDQLDALVTASDVRNGKPAGDTFRRAAELMGVASAACIVFEDTQIGVQAAQDAGMDCYLFSDGQFTFNPRPEQA